jgi:hypothetical protein
MSAPPVLILTLQARHRRPEKRRRHGSGVKRGTTDANATEVDGEMKDADDKVDHVDYSQPTMTAPIAGRISQYHELPSARDLPDEEKSAKPLPPIPSPQSQSRFVENLSPSTPRYVDVDKYEKEEDSGQEGKGRVKQSDDSDGHPNNPSGIRLPWNSSFRRKKKRRPKTMPSSPKYDRKTISRRSSMTLWEYLDFSPHQSPVLHFPSVIQIQSVSSSVRGRDLPFPVATNDKVTPKAILRSRNGLVSTNPRNVYSPTYAARMGSKF